TANAISVYPNPFTDYIVVEAQSDDRATIYDISGKPVLTVYVKAGSNRIETSALGKGVYVLKTGLGMVKIIK
ncbi:MAG: T9SS type A sorting domain-containing protein, partial [Dysgonamonadaceae bacterium]|nr:T9SS type A sorting domain-containing protein [Dysgonamonadaceae bacterium]